MKEQVKKPAFWIILIVLIILVWLTYRYYSCLSSQGGICTKSSTETIKPSLGTIIPGTRKVTANTIALSSSVSGIVKCNFFTGKKCI